MTSKEALKDISYLILQEVDNLKYKDLWKEALNTIKQDLERLEKENEQLKGNETIICDYAYSLKEENDKNKKIIDILKKHTYVHKNGDGFTITIWFNTENCGFKSCPTMEECLFIRKELGNEQGK